MSFFLLLFPPNLYLFLIDFVSCIHLQWYFSHFLLLLPHHFILCSYKPLPQVLDKAGATVNAAASPCWGAAGVETAARPGRGRSSQDGKRSPGCLEQTEYTGQGWTENRDVWHQPEPKSPSELWAQNQQWKRWNNMNTGFLSDPRKATRIWKDTLRKLNVCLLSDLPDQLFSIFADYGSEDDHSPVTTESSIRTEALSSQQTGSPSSVQSLPVAETPLASVQESTANYSQDFTSASQSNIKQVCTNLFSSLIHLSVLSFENYILFKPQYNCSKSDLNIRKDKIHWC